MSHSKLSPSSSKRWMTCPGSIRLIDAIDVTDRPSKYAAEGTVAHAIGEECLLGDMDAEDFRGEKRSADGYTFTVNQNMIDAVQVYIDFIRGKVVELKARGETRVTVHVEEKYPLTHLGVEGMDGGTSDCTIIAHKLKEVHVCDYKHGQGVLVLAENNSQARQYAAGAAYKHQIKNGDTKIFTHIIQPRAKDKQHDGISTEMISYHELCLWVENTLIPAGKACHDPNAPLVPSEKGCRFCPASPCVAQDALVQELAVVDFQDTLPEPATLSSERKMAIMDHIETIRSFLVAVEEQARNEMNAGSKEYSEKYKLVRKKTNRKFTADAMDPYLSPLLDYLEEDQIFVTEPKMVSITQIEKALKDAIGKEEASELMKSLVTKPQGEIVIAKKTDNRKEVQPAVISDFQDLDTDL